MSASKRCIFLAGAPKAETLSWDEPRLLTEFEASIERFLRRGSFVTQQPFPPSSTRGLAKWRSVTYDDEISKQQPLQSGYSRDADQILRTKTKRASHFEDHDFLEHSIAILDDLDVTQIIPTVVEDNDSTHADLQTTGVSFATTSFTDASTITTDASFDVTSLEQPNSVSSTLKVAGGVDDLKLLPKADYIERIRPSTKTVNLIVGIINVSECRTVHLRRSNRVMDLIELTVGDDTRAGFRITFWLLPENSQQKSTVDALRPVLKNLRPGHIALIQNVALTSWNGNVYGQSLSSKRFAGNGTAITLIDLDSRPIVSTPVASKLQRVRNWTSDFVGVGGRRTTVEGIGDQRKKRKLDDLLLPPDTQD